MKYIKIKSYELLKNELNLMYLIDVSNDLRLMSNFIIFFQSNTIDFIIQSPNKELSTMTYYY